MANLNIEINIRANDQASKGIGTVGKALAGLGTAGGVIAATGMAAAGAALTAGAGTAIYATGQFIQFENQLNEVFTLMPGMSEEAMSEMSQDVRGFAKEFGTLPKDVVPALYQAISAGVPADNVFSFLETAQKAAVGGVTSLETAVDGITSVVNAYGAEVMDASQASDLMFTAVKLGKTDFTQLSQSLFNVIPTAASLGVNFGDVTAALAAMTSQGTPTSVATTQLRQMLVELSKEGGKTSNLFKEIAGESFADFVKGGGDVQGALRLLEAHAGESNIGINNLFGSVEAGNAALALTGAGTEMFTNNLAEMAASAGATDVAFETMEQGIGRKIDKMKSGFSVFILDLGEMFAPMAGDLLDMVAPLFDQFASWVTSPEIQAGIQQITASVVDFAGKAIEFIPTAFGWFKKTFDFLKENKGIIIGVLAAIGAALAAFVYTTVIPAAIATITALAPIVLPLLAIAATVALLYTAWDQNWGGIQDITNTAVSWIRDSVITPFVNWLQGFWTAHGEQITGTAQAIWDGVVAVFDWFVAQWGLIFDAFSLAFQGDWTGFGEKLREAWDNAMEAIKSVASTAWDALKEIFSTAVQSVIGFFTDTDWGAVGTAVIQGIAGGITGAVGFIKDAAKSAAQAALDAAKGFLGIESPSLVFAKIGEQMMQGMAVGIREETAAPVRAVARATTTITRSAVTHNTLNIHTNALYEPRVNDMLTTRGWART